MWLLLSESSDPWAPTIHSGLISRGLAPIEHLRTADLVTNSVIGHRVAASGSYFRLRSGTGPDIDSREVAGVVNRVTGYDIQLTLQQLSSADRDYAIQEWQALLLSLLNCFQCPVLNTPTPNGLCGRYYSYYAWEDMAIKAGFSTIGGFCSSVGQTQGVANKGLASDEIAYVIGDEVVSQISDDEICSACRRLARATRIDFLQINLHMLKDKWVFVGASSLPVAAIDSGQVLDSIANVLLARGTAQ